MKKTAHKLALNRDTLRSLDSAKLQNVFGGVAAETSSFSTHITHTTCPLPPDE